MSVDEVYEVYRTAGFGDTSRAAADEAYREYLPLLPVAREARVLDLGCGGGEFLEFLRDAGFTRAEGVDRSEQQVARCHARGLAAVAHVTDTPAFLAARPTTFDAIVMNDVLEHVPKGEIVSLLRAIRSALAGGGRVVIKVPNCSNVFGLVARYLDFTHEVGFTEHSLRQVLVAAGYPSPIIRGIGVRLHLRPKRLLYWSMNRMYTLAHRAAYVAAVGTDAPRILDKLLLASAEK